MDLEFMLLDTFDGLRPKNFPKVETLEQSNTAVRRVRQAEIYLLGMSTSTNEENTTSMSSTESVHEVIQSYMQNSKTNHKEKSTSNANAATNANNNEA